MRTMMFEVQLSDWARYVAQDADGAWYEYAHKPVRGGNYGVWCMKTSGYYSYLCSGPPPADASQELYEVT